MEWKDVTSYSRSQKERKPTIWELNTGELRIVIISAHRYYPDQWVLTCHQAGIETLDMNMGMDTPLIKVKEKAITLVKEKLTKMIKSLP